MIAKGCLSRTGNDSMDSRCHDPTQRLHPDGGKCCSGCSPATEHALCQTLCKVLYEVIFYFPHHHCMHSSPNIRMVTCRMRSLNLAWHPGGAACELHTCRPAAGDPWWLVTDRQPIQQDTELEATTDQLRTHSPHLIVRFRLGHLLVTKVR